MNSTMEQEARNAADARLGETLEESFPALPLKAGSGSLPSVGTMRLRHEEFKRQIKAMRRCPGEDGTLRRNLLRVLVEALSERNFAEEYYIYPWFDGALDPVEKAGILTMMKTEQGRTSP